MPEDFTMRPQQGTMPPIPSDEPLFSRVVQEADVVEVPLLLLSWQVLALEQAAHQCGLTVAEMVRCALRDFISRLPEERGL